MIVTTTDATAKTIYVSEALFQGARVWISSSKPPCAIHIVTPVCEVEPEHLWCHGCYGEVTLIT